MSLYSKVTTDDLWMIGVEDPAPEAFAELLKRLAADREAAENCGDSLDFFIDAVSGSGENASLSRERANSCLQLQPAVFRTLHLCVKFWPRRFVWDCRRILPKLL